MSATAIKTIASIVALSVSVGAASAQEMNSNFFSGMTTSEMTLDEQKEQILNTIEEMMDEVSDLDAPGFVKNAVTIEEIDQQNRQAQRLAKELELRQLKYKEMTAQVEMLLALEKARKSLIEEEESTPAEIQAEQEAQTAAAKAQEEEQKAQQEREDAMLQQEQMSIPRVESIFGSAGRHEAIIVSVTGVTQDVQNGDVLADGFQVDEVGPKGVTIISLMSGNKYYLLPSQPTPRPQQNDQDADAIDLGAPDYPGSF